jgi:hypothetical protein
LAAPRGPTARIRGQQEQEKRATSSLLAVMRHEQVNAYLDIARENGFDGVLTISNQITAASSESPISVDGRKLKRTALWHFSWWRVLTEAIVQHRYRGISDPDQAWILGELIAYLDSAASGAGGFEDMGSRLRRGLHAPSRGGGSAGLPPCGRAPVLAWLD